MQRGWEILRHTLLTLRLPLSGDPAIIFFCNMTHVSESPPSVQRALQRCYLDARLHEFPCLKI